MLGRSVLSIRKLSKKEKAVTPCQDLSLSLEIVLSPSIIHCQHDASSSSKRRKNNTPTGFFAVYVGDDRRRFVVPTGYLSHPLLKMLLEKASEEFGFEQKNGLVVPCSVSTFQEILNAVEGCNGRFDFGNLVEEFV